MAFLISLQSVPPRPVRSTLDGKLLQYAKLLTGLPERFPYGSVLMLTLTYAKVSSWQIFAKHLSYGLLPKSTYKNQTIAEQNHLVRPRQHLSNFILAEARDSDVGKKCNIR